YILKNPDEKIKLRVCRASVVLLAIVALVVALKLKNIYTLCLEAWSFLLVSIAIPFIAGIISKNPKKIAAVISSISGFLVFSLAPQNLSHRLLGFLTSLITYIIFSKTKLN
ncbi:MAG: hypothetical protein NZ870_04655, partial [bacterium]|nr:hypothetical protein [bacterium]